MAPRQPLHNPFAPADAADSTASLPNSSPPLAGRPAGCRPVHGRRGDHRQQQGKHGGDSRFIPRCDISASPSTIRILPLRLSRSEVHKRLVNTGVDCIQCRGPS